MIAMMIHDDASGRSDSSPATPSAKMVGNMIDMKKLVRMSAPSAAIPWPVAAAAHSATFITA
jgi:hypothetical protein